MDKVLDWFGIKPAVPSMIAAFCELVLLAILATLFGVPVKPVTPGNVIAVYVVLALGHEVHRRFTIGRLGQWREQIADARRMKARLKAAELALLDESPPRVIVSSGIGLTAAQVQVLPDASQAPELRRKLTQDTT